MIVITTHGYTGLKHFLLGSTAEKVVRIAPCPVVVVRAQERGFRSEESGPRASTRDSVGILGDGAPGSGSRILRVTPENSAAFWTNLT